MENIFVTGNSPVKTIPDTAGILPVVIKSLNYVSGDPGQEKDYVEVKYEVNFGNNTLNQNTRFYFQATVNEPKLTSKGTLSPEDRNKINFKNSFKQVVNGVLGLYLQRVTPEQWQKIEIPTYESLTTWVKEIVGQINNDWESKNFANKKVYGYFIFKSKLNADGSYWDNITLFRPTYNEMKYYASFPVFCSGESYLLSQIEKCNPEAQVKSRTVKGWDRNTENTTNNNGGTTPVDSLDLPF